MTFLKFHTVTSTSSRGSIFTRTFSVIWPAKSLPFSSLPNHLVILGPGSRELLLVGSLLGLNAWVHRVCMAKHAQIILILLFIYTSWEVLS